MKIVVYAIDCIVEDNKYNEEIQKLFDSDLSVTFSFYLKYVLIIKNLVIVESFE